jgi:IS5 family transposase
LEDAVRQTRHEQLFLVPNVPTHVHARELQLMSALLDELSEAVELVHKDLICREGKENADVTKGREGMTAEQVLRALVVKQTTQCSYDELSFHLADSNTYRWFCRIGIGQDAPQKSTLQKNIKKIQSQTWEAINRMLVVAASAKGIEKGVQVRTDCTVVKSNIHAPTDATLLYDSVRVLVRLMRESKKFFGFDFTSHERSAKRQAFAVRNAKSFTKRIPHYRILVKSTKKTVHIAESIASKIKKLKLKKQADDERRQRLAAQMQHYIFLAKDVIAQTERRVFRGESVPAEEKVVSIFEPHADIIVKGRRDTHYGHKICLTTGKSGIVTDIVVEDGNPADSTLAVRMIERQRELYGKVPRQVSFDGGFATRDNLVNIKKLGVEDVAFAKRRGIEITEMVKSTWVYRKLRNFRAGVEGGISFLKRAFGLDRCTWSGLDSFKSYVYSSVFACNLLMIARHIMPNSS